MEQLETPKAKHVAQNLNYSTDKVQVPTTGNKEIGLGEQPAEDTAIATQFSTVNRLKRNNGGVATDQK